MRREGAFHRPPLPDLRKVGLLPHSGQRLREAAGVHSVLGEKAEEDTDIRRHTDATDASYHILRADFRGE